MQTPASIPFLLTFAFFDDVGIGFELCTEGTFQRGEILGKDSPLPPRIKLFLANSWT